MLGLSQVKRKQTTNMSAIVVKQIVVCILCCLVFGATSEHIQTNEGSSESGTMKPAVSDQDDLTYTDILYAAPRFDAQLILWFVHTIIWFVIMNVVAYPITLKFIKNLDEGAKGKLLKLTRTGLEKMGMDNKEDDEIFAMSADNLSVLVQHSVGGLLCLPSALGMAPSSIVHALARHGALCELGWETESSLIILYHIIFGGEAGRKKYPPFLTIFGLCLHHCLSLCLVIPFNIYYPDSVEVHEFICSMQLAAAVAMAMQFYGYLKDVSTYKELQKMRISIVVSFVIMLWTRVVRYLWLVWLIGVRVWDDGNMFLVKLMFFPMVTFTLFNIAIMLDCAHKLSKFLRMKCDEHHVGDDIVNTVAEVVAAPILTRRLSSVDYTLTRSLSRAFSVDTSIIERMEDINVLDFKSADSHIKEE